MSCCINLFSAIEQSTLFDTVITGHGNKFLKSHGKVRKFYLELWTVDMLKKRQGKLNYLILLKTSTNLYLWSLISTMVFLYEDRLLH